MKSDKLFCVYNLLLNYWSCTRSVLAKYRTSVRCMDRASAQRAEVRVEKTKVRYFTSTDRASEGNKYFIIATRNTCTQRLLARLSNLFSVITVILLINMSIPFKFIRGGNVTLHAYTGMLHIQVCYIYGIGVTAWGLDVPRSSLVFPIYKEQLK